MDEKVLGFEEKLQKLLEEAKNRRFRAFLRMIIWMKTNGMRCMISWMPIKSMSCG